MALHGSLARSQDILPTMFRSELEVEKAAGDQPDHKPTTDPHDESCILEELVARVRKTVPDEAMQKSAL